MKHTRIKIAAQDRIVAALDEALKKMADDKTVAPEVDKEAQAIVARIKRQMGVLAS